MDIRRWHEVNELFDVITLNHRQVTLFHKKNQLTYIISKSNKCITFTHETYFFHTDIYICWLLFQIQTRYFLNLEILICH